MEKLKNLNFYDILNTGDKFLSLSASAQIDFKYLINHFKENAEYAEFLNTYKDDIQKMVARSEVRFLLTLHALESGLVENPLNLVETAYTDAQKYMAFLYFLKAKTLVSLRDVCVKGYSGTNEEMVKKYQNMLIQRNHYAEEWITKGLVDINSVITQNYRNKPMLPASIAWELYVSEGLELRDIPKEIPLIQKIEASGKFNKRKLLTAALSSRHKKEKDVNAVLFHILDKDCGLLENNSYFKNKEISFKLLSSWVARCGMDVFPKIVTKIKLNQPLMESIAALYLYTRDGVGVEEIKTLVNFHATAQKYPERIMEKDRIPEAQMTSLKSWIASIENVLKKEGKEIFINMLYQVESQFFSSFNHAFYKRYDVDTLTYSIQNVRDRFVSPLRKALKENKEPEFSNFKTLYDMNGTDILEKQVINSSFLLLEPNKRSSNRKNESFACLFKELNNPKIVKLLSDKQKLEFKSLFLSRFIAGIAAEDTIKSFNKGTHAFLNPSDNWSEVLEYTLSKLEYNYPLSVDFTSKRKDAVSNFLELPAEVSKHVFWTMFNRYGNKTNSFVEGYALDTFESLKDIDDTFNKNTVLKNDILHGVGQHVEIDKLLKSYSNYQFLHGDEDNAISYNSILDSAIIYLVKNKPQEEIDSLIKLIENKKQKSEELQNNINIPKRMFDYLNYDAMLNLIKITQLEFKTNISENEKPKKSNRLRMF